MSAIFIITFNGHPVRFGTGGPKSEDRGQSGGKKSVLPSAWSVFQIVHERDQATPFTSTAEAWAKANSTPGLGPMPLVAVEAL